MSEQETEGKPADPVWFGVFLPHSHYPDDPQALFLCPHEASTWARRTYGVRAQVHEFDPTILWAVGRLTCLVCQTEWLAVYPVKGTPLVRSQGMECPNCGKMAGFAPVPAADASPS